MGNNLSNEKHYLIGGLAVSIAAISAYYMLKSN